MTYLHHGTRLQGWTRYWVAEEMLTRKPVVTGTAEAPIDTKMARQQVQRAAPNDPAEQERLFQRFMESSRSQAKQ